MKPLYKESEAMQHPILSKWLSATTCHNYWIGRSVLFENDLHIVLKHNSHTSYGGRFSENQCCHSYAKLYLKEGLDTAYGHGEILTWNGRISKKQIISGH